MNVKKQAQQDAREFARAELFYGEGAGTRRRIIETVVNEKVRRYPGYLEAFNNAYDQEDMLEHAESARKERERIDRKKKIERNTRGLLTGNKQSMTTSVIVIATVAVAAHQTGADKVVWEYSKLQYLKARRWVQKRRSKLAPVAD